MRIVGKNHDRKLSGNEEMMGEGDRQLRGQDPRWERWGASHMEDCGQAQALPAYNLCMESWEWPSLGPQIGRAPTCPFPGEALGSWEQHFLAL